MRQYPKKRTVNTTIWELFFQVFETIPNKNEPGFRYVQAEA